MNDLNTFSELEEFVLSFEGTEKELNTEIYEMIKNGILSLDLFLDYQGITQTEVIEAFEENSEYKHENGIE